MLELIIMFVFFGYAGFKFNGINGVLINIKNLVSSIWFVLKFLNSISVNLTGDGILTCFFLHYIVFVLVGFVFELGNIKKGCFGKLFGKIAYWLIGIPVAAVLNCINSLVFS